MDDAVLAHSEGGMSIFPVDSGRVQINKMAAHDASSVRAGGRHDVATLFFGSDNSGLAICLALTFSGFCGPSDGIDLRGCATTVAEHTRPDMGADPE